MRHRCAPILTLQSTSMLDIFHPLLFRISDCIPNSVHFLHMLHIFIHTYPDRQMIKLLIFILCRIYLWDGRVPLPRIYVDFSLCYSWSILEQNSQFILTPQSRASAHHEAGTLLFLIIINLMNISDCVPIIKETKNLWRKNIILCNRSSMRP